MINKLKDPFSYHLGHGATGISCFECKFYEYRKGDKEKYYCTLHKMSLDLSKADHSILYGEWFCRSIELKSENDIGMSELLEVFDHMDIGVLYGSLGKRELGSISFSVLEDKKLVSYI